MTAMNSQLKDLWLFLQLFYTFFLHKKTYLGIGKQNELCYT